MPLFIAFLYSFFIVLIEFSKPFVIQGFDASLVNFLRNFINGTLWSTEDLNILKKLLKYHLDSQGYW